MSHAIAVASCHQSFASPRFDVITSTTLAFYMMGDLLYMDGSIGLPNGLGGPSTLYNGDYTEPQTYNVTAANATITVGAASSFNGVTGQLPVGPVQFATLGTGYPTATRFTANVKGSGAQNAVAVFNMNLSATANGALAQNAVGCVLLSAPAEGNTSYTATFSNGDVRFVTVTSGTTVSWTGGLSSSATTAIRLDYANVLTPGNQYSNNAPASFQLINMNWTKGYWMRRCQQLMTTCGWNDLQVARASGYKAYFMPDDHERSNNWDFSVAQAASLGISTLPQVLDWWRTSNLGLADIYAAYFDNTPGTPLGDIPAAMVGVTGASGGLVSTADFPNLMMVHDRDDDGRSPGDAGYKGLATRTIVVDAVSAKSTMATADTITKLMLGNYMQQYIKDRCTEAVAAGVKAIWGLCGKDFFNVDNQDGYSGAAGGGNFPYTADRDQFLLWFHTNNIPIIWATGDRHCWHVAYTSAARGAAYDHISICGTPFGSQNNTTATRQIGNTPYPQMLCQGRDRDQNVHTILTWDSVNQQTIAQIFDNNDNVEEVRIKIPAGSRIPILPGGFWQRAQ